MALWATISDFPYSWPLWQRYSSKFVATQLVRLRYTRKFRRNYQQPCPSWTPDTEMFRINQGLRRRPQSGVTMAILLWYTSSLDRVQAFAVFWKQKAVLVHSFRPDSSELPTFHRYMQVQDCALQGSTKIEMRNFVAFILSVRSRRMNQETVRGDTFSAAGRHATTMCHMLYADHPHLFAAMPIPREAKLPTPSADHRMMCFHLTPDRQRWIPRRHPRSRGQGRITRHSVYSR